MSEWDGKGLPPVGVMVVLSFEKQGCDLDRFIDENVQILQYFRGSDNRCGVVVEHGYKGIGALYCNHIKFTPIKSDRDNAIEDMREIFNSAGYTTTECLGAIYDAGYRKIDPEKN